MKQVTHFCPGVARNVPDEDDNPAEQFWAYTGCSLLWVSRHDGTGYFFDISARTSTMPTGKLSEQTSVGSITRDDDGRDLTCKIMVWRFELPHVGRRARTYLRLLDFKKLLGFQRGDERDKNWLTKSWESWVDNVKETYEDRSFPGFRGHQSAKARHDKSPKL